MIKNKYKTSLCLMMFAAQFLLAQSNIKNNGFEKKSDHWNIHTKKKGIIKFPKRAGIDKSRAVLLQSSSPEIIHCSQEIPGLTVGKTYLVSAWVKGEEIKAKGKIGANMGIKGTWNGSGEGNIGTFEWKKIEFSFQALKTTETLELRLGFWGNEATGKAWFDTVEIKELDVFIAESPKKHLRIHIPKKFIEEDQYTLVENWIAKLDAVYEAYIELIGKAPYDGKTIDIQVSVQNLPGAWAWAGNPIYWTGRFVPEELKFIKQGSWSFGILHEIAHDFAFTADAYNWNEEMLANFRMFYALEKTGAHVNTNGRMFSPQEVKDYYRSLCGDKFCSDYVLYYTILVKEEIGWDAFKKAFRELENKEVKDLSNYEKYRLFIETAAKQAETSADEVLSSTAWNKIKLFLNK